MIRGRLSDQSFSLRFLVTGNPLWRTCFNWLRCMPDDLPFGEYKIDHGLVDILYKKQVQGILSEGLWYSNKTHAQIHYIVDGIEIIDFQHLQNVENTKSSSADEVLGHGKISSNILQTGDFLIIFPDLLYRSRVQQDGRSMLKKVVVSIPVQRALF